MPEPSLAHGFAALSAARCPRANLDAFGPGHVIFGTDARYRPIAPAFDTLRALDLPPEDLEQVEAGTAMKLFRLQMISAV